MQHWMEVWAEAEFKFGENLILQKMVFLFCAFWLWMAWEPVNRFDWFLENLLVVAVALVLVRSYRPFPLSNLSYALIGVFLTLHLVGAHYAYTANPLDEWMKQTFQLERNPYDRIVHFSFGLLMAYPIREVIWRLLPLRNAWSYAVAVMAVLACGAFYELIEMWVAQLVAPELGTMFLGTQGDPWDTQRDMELALYGAVLAMAINAGLDRLIRTPNRLF